MIFTNNIINYIKNYSDIPNHNSADDGNGDDNIIINYSLQNINNNDNTIIITNNNNIK